MSDNGGLTGGMGTGMKLAAGALLLHLLMKHARQEQTETGQQAPATGGGSTTGAGGMGGLGGILGGLLGGGRGQPSQAGMGGGGLGGLGAAMGGAGLGGILSGLGGLLGSLRNQGLGHQVDSWVNHGPNQPVDPRQLEAAIDPQDLDEAARQTGTDRNSVLQELSHMLPTAVDKMTPDGRLPQPGEENRTGGFDDLVRSVLGGR